MNNLLLYIVQLASCCCKLQAETNIHENPVGFHSAHGKAMRGAPAAAILYPLFVPNLI
jgi:hypothetical protein